MGSVKPILKIKDTETIQGFNGRLEDQITAKDLKDNPEKYIRTHRAFYANADEIEQELGARVSEVLQQHGTKTSVFKAEVNGKKIHVIAANLNAKQAHNINVDSVMSKLMQKNKSVQPQEAAAISKKGRK